VPDTTGLKAAIARALRRAARDCDALIISDYHYRTVKDDVFADILPAFKAADRPVSLDSRFRLLSFPGVTIATPNEPEVEDALKIRIDDDPRLLRDAGPRAAPQAPLARPPSSPAARRAWPSSGGTSRRSTCPSSARRTSSTSPVRATRSSASSPRPWPAGAAAEDAARLANFAGGIVVMKKGDATVTPLELKQAVIAGH